MSGKQEAEGVKRFICCGLWAGRHAALHRAAQRLQLAFALGVPVAFLGGEALSKEALLRGHGRSGGRAGPLCRAGRAAPRKGGRTQTPSPPHAPLAKRGWSESRRSASGRVV